MPTYTIRYRRDDRPGPAALLVEDEQGTGYLFSSGALQARCADAAACARLLGLLRRRGPWAATPAITPYTLAGLQALTGAIPGP